MARATVNRLAKKRAMCGNLVAKQGDTSLLFGG